MADNYSGTTRTFTLQEFTIDPARCEISYDCLSVTGPTRADGVTVGISCSDLTFDFVYNGEASDG